MQRTWKQSPKQSVYDIHLYTKKPRYQKLHEAVGEGAVASSASPRFATDRKMSSVVKRPKVTNASIYVYDGGKHQGVTNAQSTMLAISRFLSIRHE